jgi:hypothetical protein
VLAITRSRPCSNPTALRSRGKPLPRHHRPPSSSRVARDTRSRSNRTTTIYRPSRKGVPSSATCRRMPWFGRPSRRCSRDRTSRRRAP